MSPPAYTFAAVRARLGEPCREVLIDLAVHGPCTPRHLADASRRDILHLRPRLTDLTKLGLVILAEPSFNSISASNSEKAERRHRTATTRENIYRVATQTEWEQFHAQTTAEEITRPSQRRRLACVSSSSLASRTIAPSLRTPPATRYSP